jgi:hypothetical protein
MPLSPGKIAEVARIPAHPVAAGLAHYRSRIGADSIPAAAISVTVSRPRRNELEKE